MQVVRPPSRQSVREHLLALLSGDQPREAVADWAAQWVGADARVEDPVVWRALGHLAGADLLTAPGEYLHTEPDFHSWLDEFENGTASPEG